MLKKKACNQEPKNFSRMENEAVEMSKEDLDGDPELVKGRLEVKGKMGLGFPALSSEINSAVTLHHHRQS
jgi:hypothetical protein